VIPIRNEPLGMDRPAALRHVCVVINDVFLPAAHPLSVRCPFVAEERALAERSRFYSA